jgi:F-type H+-transporting ATPase subunit delta
MKIGKEAARAARKLFRACFVKDQLDEEKARSVMLAIVSQKPRNYLAIAEQFQSLVRAEYEKYSLLLESATPLSEADVQSVYSKVRSKFPRITTTQYRVNPSLIGGLRVKVGSDVWDGSVAARLQQLSAIRS